MTNPARLFTGENLYDRLETLREKTRRRVLDWNPDDFLGRAEADVVQGLLTTASVECPTLRRDEAELLEPAEITQQFHEFGEIVTRRITRFTLVVPFEGDANVFEMRASTFSTSPPQAEVHGSELRVFSHPAGGDAAKVKANLEQQLNTIETYLAYSRQDIENYQRALELEVPRMVGERRAKLLADRDLQANIGFPIRRRPDSESHAVPLRRRQVKPTTQPVKATATQPFKPEPVLDSTDYEDAIGVLLNTRNALERSPSTTEHLSEEGIRDLLLVSLNARFEGAAAGEVFNGAGKTDILIRVGDKNVFIGECKFWKGAKTVSDALDQLLGYLVWRDTKAALLLFIRDADVSTIMTKAVTKMEEHPNFKRRGKVRSEDRHDFVLHANSDSSREVHLALLPFLIASKK